MDDRHGESSCSTHDEKPVVKTKFDGIYNLGNPVFTYASDIPIEMPSIIPPEACLPGYECPPTNLLYRTTSAEYGSTPPTCYSVPAVFYPKTQRFSDHLGKCGMPRNRSLNCGSDKSKVPIL